MSTASFAHRHARLAVVVALCSLVALERSAAQTPSAADGPWSGQMQCVLSVRGPNYQDDQTHTWRIIPGSPVLNGVFRQWPAVWSVQGSGNRTLDTGVSETWKSAVPPTNAPLAFSVNTVTGQMRIGSQHGLLNINGAITGSTGGRALPIIGALQEWPFPIVDDVATATTISGTRTRNAPNASGWRQPPGVPTTEACTWRFDKTPATNAPESQSSAATGTTTTTSATPLRAAGAPAGTIQSTTPEPTSNTTLRERGTPSSGAIAALTSTLNNESAGPAPTGLVASPTPTSIGIRWNCPTGATGFDVFATPSGGGQVKLTQTPLLATQCFQGSLQDVTRVTSFQHGGLSPLTEFGYVVRALYTSGFTDSPQLIARTSLWPAPTGLTGAVAGRTATLRWNPIPGATGYLVFRQSPGQQTFQQITPTPVAMAAFYEDIPVGTHQYYVQAVSGNPSARVAVVSGRPEFESVAVYGDGTGAISVRWGGTADATAVAFLKAASPDGPFTAPKLQLGSNSSATEGPAQLDTVRYYKVQANYQGVLVDSEVLKVPRGISNIQGRAAGRTVDLTWTCDPAANNYKVYRRGGPDVRQADVNPAPLPGSNVCEFVDSNLYYSTTRIDYSYTVTAQYGDRRMSSYLDVTVIVMP